MICTSFEDIRNRCKASAGMKRMAIAAANDNDSIEAAIEARAAGIAEPVLIGEKASIINILTALGETIPEQDIFDEPDSTKACEIAVSFIRKGRADFLMKGKVDTGALLKAVVNKEAGLGKGRLMSHFTIFEVPSYHKLLTVVDGGMVAYPNLEQKKDIIANTVDTLMALGYTRPKVGILACVEKVNPKMPETIEADELAKLNASGEIANCIINGPISYDCAISSEIAAHKGYGGEVAGDVDILVAPNIHAGNIMGKMLTCTCYAKLAGIIVGAKCPIVLTSRTSTAEEKLYSIMLSAVVSD